MYLSATAELILDFKAPFKLSRENNWVEICFKYCALILSRNTNNQSLAWKLWITKCTSANRNFIGSEIHKGRKSTGDRMGSGPREDRSRLRSSPDPTPPLENLHCPTQLTSDQVISTSPPPELEQNPFRNPQHWAHFSEGGGAQHLLWICHSHPQQCHKAEKGPRAQSAFVSSLVQRDHISLQCFLSQAKYVWTLRDPSIIPYNPIPLLLLLLPQKTVLRAHGC